MKCPFCVKDKSAASLGAVWLIPVHRLTRELDVEVSRIVQSLPTDVEAMLVTMLSK